MSEVEGPRDNSIKKGKIYFFSSLLILKAAKRSRMVVRGCLPKLANCSSSFLHEQISILKRPLPKLQLSALKRRVGEKALQEPARCWELVVINCISLSNNKD